jgi:hypothetical protein
MTIRPPGTRGSVCTAFALGLGLIALAVLTGGCGSSGGGTSSSATESGSGSAPTASSPSSLAPVRGAYSPAIDPANFVAVIDNRYFPLKPGTTFRYQGVAEDGKTPQTDVMVVTHRKKRILGVDCTVVRDTVSSQGRAIEKTFDWYAQDRDSNVWYMGEDTRELQHGRFVKAVDSWTAGIAGAKPGIIMPGAPAPGQRYRQEYYPGHALDQARVLGPGGPVTVSYGSFKRTLLTVETAPKLDPGVAERKYYVAGLGDVKEHTVSGNREEIRLVSVTH